MNSLTDQQLLRDYVERKSDAAFAELVQRHVDHVHSTALRLVCDSHLARDVTQGAFVALAQNARQLTGRPILSGWLHLTTRNLAANIVRSEVRRRAREQEAVAMNQLLANEPDASWDAIAPHLDAALGELNETERDAVMLRYFERKSARQMAEILGMSEDAAQKRVSRAVEHLREGLTKQRLAIGAAGLATLISVNAVQSAPMGLAATISTAAALSGTAISTSTFVAATKTIAMTALQKTLIVAVVAAVTGTGIYAAHENSKLHGEIQALQQQQAPLTAQIQQLQQERDDATNRLAGLLAEKAQWESNANQMELLQLRGELTRLKNNEAQRENDPVEAAAEDWVKRVNQTKEWLKQTPDQSIPELQLLSPDDWLGNVSAMNWWSETTNNFSFALGVLRTNAKRKFANDIGGALDKYLLANDGQLPNDLSALAPYFKDDPEYSDLLPDSVDSMLQRYELLQTGNVNIFPDSEPLISERPITQNAQYDALFKIGAFGYSYAGISPLGFSSTGNVKAPTPNKLKKLFKSQ